MLPSAHRPAVPFAHAPARAGATLVALAAAALLILASAGAASAQTVWLCRPGHRPDPCTPGLSTTVYSSTLTPLRVIHPHAVRHPSVDCFYVYPTVSDQKTANANLRIDPEERSIALYQAARYSQVCRVFAPMYRQITLAALNGAVPVTAADRALGLADVRAAFRTYLRRYNHGRGFILIGHSQGAFVLRSLIARDVDRRTAIRRRMLSAILLGGNVLVKRGSDVGGDFKHIRACRSSRQLSCVIAFSTFDAPPPPTVIFGRTAIAGDEVLCTNPAALGGGTANVAPIFPSRPFAPGTTIAAAIVLLGLVQPRPSTVWLIEPDSYRAQCVDSGGADVLDLSARDGAQVARPSPTADWGLHLLDANIALGNLIDVVSAESRAYRAVH